MKPLIYVMKLDAWTQETLASYERIASDVRRQKAGKLKNLPDRVRCIGAGILLAQAYAYEKKRQMIREPADADSLIWLELPPVEEAKQLVKDCPVEQQDKNGKPYFAADAEAPRFNISHAGSFVCCCMADKPVGIDIEHVRKKNAAVSRRCFTLKEAALADVSDEKFTEIWTQKEALCKLSGKGIAQLLDGQTEGLVTSSWLDAEYVVSVAYEE